MNEKNGEDGRTVSGNTTSSAPLLAASAMASQTFAVVPSQLYKTGLSCTAAARTIFGVLISVLPRMSERPGVHDERVALSVQQNNVEHIERVERADAFDQRALAMAIQYL